ncbi:uncharacterized protein YALI1_A04983g [Yarrowia lipolytica]|uniref:Uncharacterized protein n=1 Tax=Yarrowia lipolytica TaxID=4952 RepID=A0A1D8N3Q0_YARLL|nr:hypothetical protein YALI1_A04983g [Yarrowia lipolytica]
MPPVLQCSSVFNASIQPQSPPSYFPHSTAASRSLAHPVNRQLQSTPLIVQYRTRTRTRTLHLVQTFDHLYLFLTVVNLTQMTEKSSKIANNLGSIQSGGRCKIAPPKGPQNQCYSLLLPFIRNFPILHHPFAPIAPTPPTLRRHILDISPLNLYLQVAPHFL